jgi:hypothetical protein
MILNGIPWDVEALRRAPRDLVVERGADLLGIEVKATSRPQAGDAKHLGTFRDEYGDSVRGCLGRKV